MRPVRRRLASVESAIAQLAEPAPPEPAFYEVIRQHTDCRVQLAGWGIPTEDKARTLAARLNSNAEAAGGFTLATSGHLERGWVYRWRKGSS